MKIIIIGSGGIGGYIGGKLAQAGHELLFVDRWAEHVTAINQQGLQVSGEEDFTIRAGAATSVAPERWGDAELLILATKYRDTPAVLAQIAQLPVRYVTTIQNGLNQHLPLLETFGAARTVGMITLTSGSLLGPGQIRGYTNGRPTFVGPVVNNSMVDQPGVSFLHSLLAATTLPLHRVESIPALGWCKMIWWIPLGLVPVVTRLTWREAYTQRDGAILFTQIERECAAVAQALGHEIRDYPALSLQRRLAMRFDEAVDDTLAWGQRMVQEGMADYKAAMLLDLERRRRTEVEASAGVIVGEAERLGMAVPYTEFAWRAIRLVEATFA
jgi:2-dehydropantoate 2-reductase